MIHLIGLWQDSNKTVQIPCLRALEGMRLHLRDLKVIAYFWLRDCRHLEPTLSEQLLYTSDSEVSLSDSAGDGAVDANTRGGMHAHSATSVVGALTACAGKWHNPHYGMDCLHAVAQLQLLPTPMIPLSILEIASRSLQLQTAWGHLCEGR